LQGVGSDQGAFEVGPAEQLLDRANLIGDLGHEFGSHPASVFDRIGADTQSIEGAEETKWVA